MGLRIYIASGLDNAPAVRRLANALKERGHSITYDWTAHGSVHSVSATAKQNELALGSAAHGELNGVTQADAVVVLLPGGRGTHIEMGAALALRKPIVLCAAPEVLAGLRPVSFYFHPLVRTIEMAEEEQRERAVVKTIDLYRSLAEAADA